MMTYTDSGLWSSKLRLSLFKVLNRLEAAIAGVLNDLLRLPICSENSSLANSHSRHLECKQIHIWLHGCLSHGVVASVENAAVLEEPSWESTKYHNFIGSDLHYTSTLAFSELSWRYVYDNPRVRPVLRVVSLDGVAVLLAWLCNAAENKDEALVVCATWMVVSTDIHVWDFKPKIEVDVVLLAATVSFIFFTAWTCHNQELVAEAANWVSMTRVLHIIHAETIEYVRVIVDNLEAILEGRWLALNITASN